MTYQQIYDQLLRCAKHEVEDWLKADKITPMEQACRYMPVVSGIVMAGLYLLPNDMYFKLKKEVQDFGGIV